MASGILSHRSAVYKMIRKYRFVGIAALLIIMAFAHNGSVSLWDQDEAAYAGISRQMYESGDWLIQEFTWSEIHRKPPLHFWNITSSYHVFGVNEFAVRVPPAVFFIGTLALLFFWGRTSLERSSPSRLTFSRPINACTTRCF